MPNRTQPDAAHSTAFDNLKARYCLGAIALAWYLQPGSGLLWNTTYGTEWYWSSLGFHYYAHAVIALFALVAIMAFRVDTRRLFGPAPQAKQLKQIIVADVFLFCFSSAVVTLIYFPLSLFLPNFVSWWLDWSWEPAVYLDTDGTISVIPNALSVLSLVVLAPVLEEILFRGFLLHRLARKWGLMWGIVASSALFGAIHPEPLGIAVFGVGMCLLYLRTQSLFVPILAHGFFNLTVWTLEVYGVWDEGFEYYRYDLEKFQGEWWIGAIGALVTVVMIDRHLRRGLPAFPTRLPAA